MAEIPRPSWSLLAQAGESDSSNLSTAKFEKADGPEPPPPPNPNAAAAPKQIGRYRIVKVLGEGGFGKVYLAHDDQLDRPVAIKVLHRHRLAEPGAVETYLTEARILASLDQPNIVPVHDVGKTEDGLCYVVSKFIEGTDLAKKLLASRPSFRESAEIAAALAEALHYAHRKGLVHRDVKPANVLIDAAGKAYLADFGLALKEEEFGKGAEFAGTPAYMSPEQARGEGHRVEGRSDVFSLGVVLYEMLVGRRPFRGDTQSELFEQITTVEARPPRQVDDAIPRELERICLKAMAKRASERYTTGRDLAEDLRSFLQRPVPETSGTQAFASSHFAPVSGQAPPRSGLGRPSTITRLGDRSLRIVPKGLRSFDANDADFFLELLPGPRDRDGLPDSIRFWKTRIEEHDADKTFSLGLLYGPSGCGKSSLVKAGLLPRLDSRVLAVYIEATAQETEARLLKGLRKQCPDLAPDLGLPEAVAALRRGQGLPPGCKLLIVLDQFEQWLHAKRDEAGAELIQALRHCDGDRTQCLVMVRDDFWLAVSRFLKELEVPLLEGQNSALVDLFDARHAKKVLAAFGQAFETLPERFDQLTSQQKAFLDRAISGLLREGKVICVRLALFAEMMKGKPWNLATLKAIGGTEGVGVTFLEETFSAQHAPPEHQLHQKAARSVLKSLLPEQGTNIKGHMRSYQELLHVSGYADRPRDFEGLLRILDSKLRLLTPTDPEGLQIEDCRLKIEQQADTSASQAPAALSQSAIGNRQSAMFFQLSHDYLVPALRDWLTRKQKETRRGRAELRLAERAAGWNAKPETRSLPAWWEFLLIRCLVPQRDWTEPQRHMMTSARTYYLVCTGILATGLVLLGLAGMEAFGRFKAHALRDRLLDAHTKDVAGVVSAMKPYQGWLQPLLRESYADAEQARDARRQLHASLALLPVDPGQADYLYEQMLDAEPQEVLVIRDALLPQKEKFVESLWALVERPERGRENQRLRAACALAIYDPANPRWDQVGEPVVEKLVAVDPASLALWADGLRPVKGKLMAPLSRIFRDHNDERTAERALATAFVADYAADQPDVLADLIRDADTRQHAALFPKLQRFRNRAADLMAQQLAKTPDAGATEAAKEALAKRQAQAAVILLQLGRPEDVWTLLQHRADPGLRSYLIQRLSALGADSQTLATRLETERDVSVRRGLILSLGGLPLDKVLVGGKDVVDQLVRLYRDDPDPGIHSAVEWALRQWRQIQRLEPIDQEFRGREAGGDRRWYVNGQAQTMAVIRGPVEFWMGSPVDEPDRRPGESAHRKRIARSFAIAVKEVTVEQFQHFLRSQPAVQHEYTEKFSPDADGPMISVTWYEAAQYCRWLSEQEKIPKEQMCYPPIPEIKAGMKMPSNYLALTGYRLPTEAEWEYACRAEAATIRTYGAAEDMLGQYAWFSSNSKDRAWPVGRLKPNDFGLFDVHGSVWEWCQDPYLPYPQPAEPAVSEDREFPLLVQEQSQRVLRGGAFGNYAAFVRSACRNNFRPGLRYIYDGLRVAEPSPADAKSNVSSDFAQFSESSPSLSVDKRRETLASLPRARTR